MTDTASHDALQPVAVAARHTMTVREVEAELIKANVHRSHRTILRLCQSGAFDAIKIPAPSGDEWYVSPVSVPKVIGDLQQMDEQRARRGAPQLVMSFDDAPGVPDYSKTVMPGHDAPRPVMTVAPDNPTRPTQGATARHTAPDVDIYEHPYVRQLEERASRFEKKYDDLVLRNEEREARRDKDMIELQRMITVGQSETLANFMLKAKDLILGTGALDKVDRPLADAS